MYNDLKRKDVMDGLNPKIFIPAVIVFTLVFYALAISLCYGDEIPEDRAVKAIIGEAASEGYDGMLAVAAAIRNRGTLRGVYGERAPHVVREPRRIWDLARKAWRESAGVDPTGGADHWESINFKKPAWADSMTKTVLIGKHQFYRKG
jgi:hypothetical protein